MNRSSLCHSATTFLFATLLIVVTGCKTTETPLVGKALDSLAGHQEATKNRLSTAAVHAIAEGKTNEALNLYERLYTQTRPDLSRLDDPEYQNVSLNYAQLLRKKGKIQRAFDVLDPFMEVSSDLRQDYKPSSFILNEYAAASIETGNFEKAENLLNQVLEDKTATESHADAHNLLGILLDAKGQHKEARQSFQQALDNWKGNNKTSVMNNLGLCLANQGMFDESLMILRQALVIAPQKQKIASNIQMVTDLRKSIVPTAPVNLGKKKSQADLIKD